MAAGAQMALAIETSYLEGRPGVIESISRRFPEMTKMVLARNRKFI